MIKEIDNRKRYRILLSLRYFSKNRNIQGNWPAAQTPVPNSVQVVISPEREKTKAPNILLQKFLTKVPENKYIPNIATKVCKTIYSPQPKYPGRKSKDRKGLKTAEW